LASQVPTAQPPRQIEYLQTDRRSPYYGPDISLGDSFLFIDNWQPPEKATTPLDIC